MSTSTDFPSTRRAPLPAPCPATRAAVRAGAARHADPRGADDPARRAARSAEPVDGITHEGGA
ncbi:hypothetical protein [Saccharothrix algeriensis]|uniref:Uncharacterized protein n=1 Tax=Saccharothrix algeriensis TaxID=173560 RepID=A0A8T8I213_9PSEU|nr:hypothetical protein [Saccharothrix algeriensis]MBM7810759.1 hypothetical protein [Saccharothrix algeriensis]QTR04806.1 hypothetical protein J7S33_08420 [Saccharothrix algeriensis]